jgi:hypothetical protein
VHSRKLHTIFIYSLLLCIPVLKTSYSLSQENQQAFIENVQVQFLKDSLEIEGNSFEFNSCSLLYSGEGSLNIEAKIESPSSINILSPLSTTQVQLKKAVQQFIPIRFISTGITKVEWQPITISFYLKETGKRFSRQFWIRPKAYSKWNAQLIQPDITIAEKEGKASFSMVVQNTGSIEDEYRVSLETKMEVQKNKKDLEFTLQPNEKRVLTFLADLNYLKLHHEHKGTINVFVKSKTGNQKFLVQNIAVIGHQYSQEFYPWKTMPLSVEFSVQSSPLASPFYSSAVYGTANLGSGRSVTVNSRINDIRQYKTYNTSWMEYESPKWSILAGDIVDFHHFLIHGTGISLANKFDNGKITAAGIKSSIGDVKQGELQLLDTFGKKLVIYSDNFTNQDATRRIYSSLSVNHLYWIINNNTTLSLLAGASIEKSNTWKFATSLPGSAWGYEVESKTGKLNLHSEVSYYSKSFPGFYRGYTFQDHELSARSRSSSFGAYYTTNKKVYTNDEDSLLTNLFNVNNTELGLKAGISSGKIVLGLTTALSRQQQDSASSIIVQGWKSTANVIFRIAPEYTLSLNGSFGLFAIKDLPSVKPFPAYTTYGSFQHKQLGLFFQYNSGPYYYFEAKQYLKPNTGFKRIMLAPYYEQQLKKLNGFFRSQLMYNKDASINMSTVSINNQLQYSLPGIKADFIINTSYNFSYKDASYVSATVRKTINLPVLKNRISNHFSVVLFKDLNNNDRFDPDTDEVLPNSLVLANDNLVQTDQEGEIKFSNVGADLVKLDFRNTNFNGWIPKAGFLQKILPVKKAEKVYIPFKQSRYVKGKLFIVTDDNSSETFELANIAITATDDKGNLFKTLTDNNGEFILNLPSSTYIISINGSVFDDKFTPTEISKTADLVNNESIGLSFEIRQKKRQINIHHSSD